MSREARRNVHCLGAFVCKWPYSCESLVEGRTDRAKLTRVIVRQKVKESERKRVRKDASKRERRQRNKTIAFEFGLVSVVNVLATVSPFAAFSHYRCTKHLFSTYVLSLSTKLQTLVCRSSSEPSFVFSVRQTIETTSG